MRELRRLRRSAYRVARFIGDVQAILGGPRPMIRRFVRKRALRMGGGFINRRI